MTTMITRLQDGDEIAREEQDQQLSVAESGGGSACSP